MKKKIVRLTEGQLRKIIESVILKEGTWELKRQYIPVMIKELKLFEKKWWNIVGDDELYDGIDAAIKRLKELEIEFKD